METRVILDRMRALAQERKKKGMFTKSHMCKSMKLQRIHIVNRGATIRIYYACRDGFFIEPIEVRNVLGLLHTHIQRHPRTFSNVCFSVDKMTVTLSTGGKGNPFVRINLAGRMGVERFCSVSWQVARMMEDAFRGHLWVTHISHDIGNNVIVINPSQKHLSVEKIITSIQNDTWKYDPEVFPGMNVPGSTVLAQDKQTTTKKVIGFTSNMLNCLGNRDLRSFTRDLPGILKWFDKAEVARSNNTPQENSRLRKEGFEKYKNMAG